MRIHVRLQPVGLLKWFLCATQLNPKQLEKTSSFYLKVVSLEPHFQIVVLLLQTLTVRL